MTLRAIFLDFYGTVVHGDDRVLGDVCERIASVVGIPSEQIATWWWNDFCGMTATSFGPTFQTQRVLDAASSKRLLEHFGADIPVSELNEARYRHWQQPPLFDDALRFLAGIDPPLAVCAVSNIDRHDIEAAAAFHGLNFDAIVTSQDARAYKPRREVFDLALDRMGISATEVVHVGDSLSSDVAGAQAVGIPAVWVNRQGKEPKGVAPDHEIGSFDELPALLESLM